MTEALHSPVLPPAVAVKKYSLSAFTKRNSSRTRVHSDSDIPIASSFKRFSLNLFSKDHNHHEMNSDVSLPETTNSDLDEPLSKTKTFITDLPLIDDSVISKSFGGLDLDCSSFFSIPPANTTTCIVDNTSVPTETVSTQLPSHQSSIAHTRRSSVKRLRSTSTPLSRKSKEEWYEDFKLLDSGYHKFMSKSGVNKANVLRLALLPFLRQQRGEFYRATPEEGTRRVCILQKWWAGILSALRDRDRPVSGSDRSAYLEAISGIVGRNEWTTASGSMRLAFENYLYDTLTYVISKLSLKTVPTTFAAFAGKILAYAFFYAPGVAPVLLHLLHVSKSDVRRLLKVSFPEDHTSSNQYTDLSSAANLVTTSFPIHLTHLIADETIVSKVGLTSPPCPTAVPDLYGPWSRRWVCFNSDVFYSFFKHYYTIISRLLPAELPWNAHLASPGLIIIHAFLLGTLDSVVHPRKRTKNFVPEEFTPTSQALDLTPVVYNRRRVDQLKMLAAVREILHNDDICAPFFEPYCVQFEKILHAVALKTSLYDLESCIILCDLVEEFLSSLILSNSHSKHRVLMQKDNVIDWEFWIHVIQRMLTGENSNTELRALAFLFNVWDNIPISSSNNTASHSNTDHQRRCSESKTDDNANQETIFDLYFDDQEGLRWNCTVWLLSSQLWKRYFCHWHPLVRAYYLRLLCWRVASVGSESGLLSSVIFSNYNSDVRFLLDQRLKYTFSRFHEYTCMTKLEGRPIPSAIPCDPVLNRKLKIAFNPASTQSKPLPPLVASLDGTLTPSEQKDSPPPSTRRIDPYEVFDDVVYSLPSFALPSDLLTSTSPGASDLSPSEDSAGFSLKHRSVSTSAMESFGNVIKKRWSNLRGNSSGNLKTYFDSPSAEDEHDESQPSRPLSDYSDYTPSLTFSSSTMSSSNVHTPMSDSSISARHSPDSMSPQTENQSLDKLKGQSGSPSSLTLSLIPPPPQILRKRPEVTRALYKFSLEYSEKAIRKQQNILRRCQVAPTPTSENHEAVAIPHLPFDLTSEDSSEIFGHKKLNRYTSGFANNLHLVLDLYDGGKRNDEIDDIISQYSVDDEDSDANEEAQDVVNSEFEYTNLSGRERFKQKSLDNTKFWKYAGRSLNEWDAVVSEFQEFVTMRTQTQGAIRVEDVCVPFMIAEIPAKALVGVA